MIGSYDVKTKLTDKDGTIVAQNALEIDVFGEDQLKTPKAKIAIIDTTDELRTFLKKSGIDFIEFDKNTPEDMTVFTGRAIAKKPADKAKFKELESFVKKGGTAVYLETILRVPGNFWTRRLPQHPIFPFKAKTEASFGLWVGVPHIVTDHPIFKGLPSECMMGQAYANIFAPHTLSDIEGEIIVGSVSHGFYGNNDNLKNYTGPSPAWYGMDLGIVQHGKGKYVLSALRIVENIGKDPIADKILFNLINWTNK